MSDINKEISFYEDRFFGMNLRMDEDKLPDGFSPLAVNVDLTRMKTLKSRKGTVLFGQKFDTSGSVQNLIELVTPTGFQRQLMVKNGTLYKYTDNLWENIKAGYFSQNLLSSVTYKNKVYYTSKSDALSSTIGDSNISPVGTFDNQIKGKCLGVGQRTLFIGDVVINNVNYPDRVYYSRFDIDNRTEGDEFWEEVENGIVGNLNSSTRFFRVEGGIVQAISSFANRDRVYIFSDTKCYSFNVSQAETNPFSALNEIFPIGCAGPNAVTVVNSMMYWADKEGRLWAWSGGTTRPEEISYNIDSENLDKSIVTSIDKTPSNLEAICAFGYSKQIYFSVGEIALSDKRLANSCLKLFISQNGLMSYTCVDTFPERILCSHNFRIGQKNIITAGTASNVVELNTGLNDVSATGEIVAIDSFYRTRSYNFDYPLFQKKVENIYIQFKPTFDKSNSLELLTRTERSTNYILISNPSTPDKFGTIEMFEEDNQILQKISKINLPNDVQGDNISFEFANRELDGSFEITAFGTFNVKISKINIGIL